MHESGACLGSDVLDRHRRQLARGERVGKRNLRDTQTTWANSAPRVAWCTNIEREPVHAYAARDVDAACGELRITEPHAGWIATKFRARYTERRARVGERTGDARQELDDAMH